MRHVSRTHRVALDWLFDRTNLDPKVQIKYVESKNQIGDILTKGSFTREEWHNLLHQLNIMNDTAFSCSQFFSQSFLSAEKESEKSKRYQESSSLCSPMVKAKAWCLVSRQCVSVGQDCSINPESPEVQETLKCEWNEKSGRYSVQHATRKVVQNIKTNADTMKASRKYPSTLRRCTFRYGRDLWRYRSRQHCTWTRVTKRIWNYSRILYFENSKGLFGMKRMVIERNSEIKNVFPADVAGSLWVKPVLLKEQAIKSTKARVYVYSDSVLCLRKQHGPEDAIRRWIDQVSTLKTRFSFRELKGLEEDPIDFEWKIFPGAKALKILHKIQADLPGKNITPSKIQWLNNLHVNVQWHWTGKER